MSSELQGSFQGSIIHPMHATLVQYHWMHTYLNAHVRVWANCWYQLINNCTTSSTLTSWHKCQSWYHISLLQ